MKKLSALILSIGVFALVAYGGERKARFRLSPATGEIVVSACCAPAVRFAAEELNATLARSFGVALPVVNRPTVGKVSLILGDTEWSRAAGIDVAKIARDGFAIKTARNRVFIVGRDDPTFDLPEQVKAGDFVKVFETEHATVFAVYEFLERFLGARFYFPGEFGTVVPRHEAVTIEETDLVTVPECSIREYWAPGCGAEPGEENRGYFVKYTSVWKTRLMLYQRMSSVHIRVCHGQTGFRIPSRFEKTHPEYFALLKDRKTGEVRRDNDFDHHLSWQPGQLCQSSRMWEDVLYPETKARLLAGEKFVDVMPNDSMAACLCDLCQAAYSKDPKDCHYATELVWTKTAELARRLIAEKVPGNVAMMAYPPYGRVPDFDLPTNILVQVAKRGPWGVQFPEVWQRDNAEVRGWAEKVGHKVWLWTYPAKWGQYITPCVPQMTPKAYAKYYKSVSAWIFGAVSESDSDMALYNYLNHYVFGRVMWNSAVDTDALLKEHYEVMFGAAADLIERFYDDLEHKWIDDVTGHGKAEVSALGPGTWVFPSEQEMWTRIYSASAIAEWERLFDAALLRVGASSDEGRRIAYIREQFLVPLAGMQRKMAGKLAAVSE